MTSNPIVAALDAQAALQRAVSPLVDAALRLFLAQLLWRSGVGGLMHWQARLEALAPIARMAAMRATHAAVVQTGGELILPVLLVLGLFVRPASLALTAAGAAAWWMGAETGLVVALLGFWFFAAGAGPLSLDHVLSRGLASSALPLAGPAMRLGAALRAGLVPVALLAARLGVGLVLWRHGMAAGPVAMGAVLCMAAGLATRLAAAPLFGVTLVAAMHGMSELHLAFVLLLCLLAAFGPGAVSIDALLGFVLRGRLLRYHAWQATRLAGLPHVVIVGGGFGGLAAARALRRAPCRITLVDERNYHLFQPLLYQVATASLSPADIATPIRQYFRAQPNACVLLARVDGVDVAARHVSLESGEALAYDFLVLATGARHAYFGHDGWARFAPGLKTIEDATDIRSRLLLAFERAEAEPDAEKRLEWLTFAVVGGGPTGVELAGAIAELARHGMAGEFRAIDPACARVILLQSGARVLPAFPPSLSAAAARSLGALGVELRLGAAVDAVDETGFSVGGERVACRTVFWAAGVAASAAGVWMGAERDRAGRVKVAADLSVPGQDCVFAIGDTACVADAAFGSVPGLAPAARQGGAYVARVIAARLAGRTAPKPFLYRHDGSLATIGRRAAVADLGRVSLTGAAAWWFWGAVHILFLAGTRNRVTVAVQWLWAYLTFGRGIRLITRPASSPPQPA
jgi:NADH dehydrogenase FAD-containing subunit/uncharacterized membrane protein YphA (DoxX/SURF4 family)